MAENKKRMGLLSICKKVIYKSHGLAFVPVDRNKFNFLRKRYSGILTHRPFTIRTEGKEVLRNWLNFRIPRNSCPPHLHVSGGFEDRGITQ